MRKSIFTRYPSLRNRRKEALTALRVNIVMCILGIAAIISLVLGGI